MEQVQKVINMLQDNHVGVYVAAHDSNRLRVEAFGYVQIYDEVTTMKINLIPDADAKTLVKVAAILGQFGSLDVN